MKFFSIAAPTCSDVYQSVNKQLAASRDTETVLIGVSRKATCWVASLAKLTDSEKRTYGFQKT